MVKVKKIDITGYLLPVMIINLKESSIISVPSQIGCMIDCSFCISKDSKFIRSLNKEEIIKLVDEGRKHATNQKILISFTGEGEPFLNLKAINQVMEELSNDKDIYRFRICTSGIKPNLLKNIKPTKIPINLQFSLHSPFDEKRKEIVPKTKKISAIFNEMKENEHLFDEIAINYVLIKGFNDTEDDLQRLISTVDKNWVIKLNPLLGEKTEQSKNKDHFYEKLTKHGFVAKNFKKIGSKISNGFYGQLTYEKSNSII